MKEMITCFLAREHNFTGRLQYASVLLAYNECTGCKTRPNHELFFAGGLVARLWTWREELWGEPARGEHLKGQPLVP